MTGRTAGESTEVPISNPEANHVTEPIDNLHLAEGIPKDILTMFGVNLSDTDGDALNKLRDIASYAMDGEMFVGDGMLKLRGMIERLPTQDQGKHEAVWNLISLQKKINTSRKELVDLEKRKSALYSMGMDFRRPC